MSNRITFYSVSPVGNDVDMKVTANITISNGVATLTNAQTGNIGAGCRIEYNSTHAYIAPNRIGFDSGGTVEIKIGDKIEGATSGATGIVRAVHISSGSWSGGDCAGHIYFEKTTGTWQDNEQINRVKPTSSSNVGTTDGTLEGNIGDGNTEFVVLTATGADAGDQSSTSVTHIYHEYGSLALWEAGFTDSSHLANSADLTTNNDICYACCYYDHVDSTADESTTTFDAVTGSDSFIFVFALIGDAESINKQRHSGKWDTDKSIMVPSSTGNTISIQTNVKICGLQVKRCLGDDADTHSVLFDSSSSSTVAHVFECLIDVTDGNASGTGGLYGGYNKSGNIYAYNNVVFNGAAGYKAGCIVNNSTNMNWYCYCNTCISGNFGFYRAGSATVVVKNNIAQDCTDGFNGTFTSSDYNVSDISGDAPGTNSKFCSVSFKDAANDDYSLNSSDACAKDAGTDLSSDSNLPIWRDIAGNERDTSTPDIGAFEYVAAGGGSTMAGIYYRTIMQG